MEAIYTILDITYGLLIAGAFAMIALSHEEMKILRILVIIAAIAFVARWTMWAFMTEQDWLVRGFVGAIVGALLFAAVPALIQWSTEKGKAAPPVKPLAAEMAPTKETPSGSKEPGVSVNVSGGSPTISIGQQGGATIGTVPASPGTPQSAPKESYLFHMPARMPIAGVLSVDSNITATDSAFIGPEAGVASFKGIFKMERSTAIATGTLLGVPEYQPNHKFSKLSNKELKGKTLAFTEEFLALKADFQGQFGAVAYKKFGEHFAADTKELFWELGERLLANGMSPPDNIRAQASILTGMPVGTWSFDGLADYLNSLAAMLPQ